MRDLIVRLVHLAATLLQLVRPGGLRAAVAESVLLKHQLLIVNRSCRRAPILRVLDRLIAGFCSLWIRRILDAIFMEPGRTLGSMLQMLLSTARQITEDLRAA